jgi:hypothetical protein
MAIEMAPQLRAYRLRPASRVEVVDTIQSHIRSYNVPITLLNVGHGGFLVPSLVDHAVVSIDKSRFTLPGDPYSLFLRGRVAHEMCVTINDNHGGMEFIDQHVSACGQAIDLLIAAVMHRG